ncbi:hypothetical protein Y032_0029g1961 [Ancylostoma ceylanicum]|uniref:Integrase catalytic domain-containing protein n=1 Tax=Ancylostoma ceylanicum TaxID=53326 RepID=A0A016UR87_9BILA|nr:hypothetical protein Y032_0029g1961 [Ancylostoma ceylanicum]
MLKKKTVTPTEWDRILPSVVYAYNASPHAATAESPHFLVYGHDPKYPSEIIPREHLSPYHVDYDNYKTEFLSGLTLARACIAEHAEKYRATMKQQYDRCMKTAASQVFNTGDRVYMTVPSEKGKSTHPKLAFDWRGPYRVLEASSNSALITRIGANEEPARVQFDHLVKVPAGIDDTPRPSFDPCRLDNCGLSAARARSDIRDRNSSAQKWARWPMSSLERQCAISC